MPSLADLLVKVGIDATGFKKGVVDLSNDFKAIDKEARQLERTLIGFDKIGGRMTELGQSLTVGITLPLVAAGAAAVKFASDFDGEMRKVTSLLGGSTQKEFEALRGQVLELARSMGVDATKAANALYEAISAGVPKENAIEFLAVSAKTAIAGVTDTKVAVDSLTTIIAAYNLKWTEAKNVSDAMFQAVNVGKFTFEQLAGAIGPAAAQAKNLGVSYQELLAATATLSISSGGVGQAVTQVESAMRALLDPTKQMQSALHQIGFESGSAAVKSLGLEGTLEALRKTTKGSAEQFNALFGRIEGASGALGLTGDRAAAAAADFGKLNTSAGATQKAFEEIEKSAPRQFQRALAEIQAIGIELGTSMLPAVRDLLAASKPFIQTIADLVKQFAALPEPVRNTALALGALTAALGPSLIGVGQLIIKVPEAVVALKSMAGAMGALSNASSLLGVGLKALPWVALAAGIALALDAMLKTPTAMDNIKKAADKKAEGLALLNQRWRENQIELGNLAPKQKGAYDTLLSFVQGLDKTAASAAKAHPPIKSLADQIEALQAALKPVEESAKLASLQFDALFRAFQNGNAKLADLEKAYTRMIAAQDRLDPKRQADEMDRAFQQEVDAAEKWAKEFIEKTEGVDTSAKDLAGTLKLGEAAFKSWAEKGVQVAVELKDRIDPAILDIVENFQFAGRVSNDLTEAYKTLGIKGPTELRKLADASQDAFEQIGADTTSAITRQRAYIVALEDEVKAAQAAGQKISEAQKKQLDQARAQLEDALGDQESAWKRYRDSVLDIFHNMGRDLTRSFIDVFSSDWNKNLDQQVADLRASLSERKSDLDRFTSETEQKIVDLSTKYSDQIAQETADLRAQLAERRADYEQYAREVAAREQEISRAANESLAQQLGALERSLAERTRALDIFTADTNRKLTLIGQDLAERLADITRAGNRSIEDENTSHARTVEDLNEQIRRAQQDGDAETTARLSTELQRRMEDHAKALQRIREDTAQQTADAQRAAQQQADDARLALQRQQEEHAKFVEETNRQREEITRINRENLARELADLQKQLMERKSALEQYGQQVEAQIVALQEKYRLEQEAEVAALRKALADKIAEYAAFNSGVLIKLKELEDAHKSTLDKIAEAFENVFKRAALSLAEFVASEQWKKLETRLKEFIDGTSAARKSAAGLPGGFLSDSDYVEDPTAGMPSDAVGPGGGPSGAGGGGRAGGIQGILQGYVAPISAALTAVSSIVGNVQFAHMNTALGRIEESTRYAKILLTDTLDRANIFWPNLAHLHDFNYSFWAPNVAHIEDTLEQILGALGGAQMESLSRPIGGPMTQNLSGASNINITINNPVIRDDADIDRLMAAINTAVGGAGRT